MRQRFPNLEAAYDRLVQRIASIGADGRTPSIGDEFPDFLLVDMDGRFVDLRSLLASGPLVVSFNRGSWCGYCGLQLRALARAYPDILTHGAQVVSIVPDTARYAKSLAQTRQLPFVVLTDLDLGYALSLGLVFWVGDDIKDMYQAFGVDLTRFQHNDGWFLPVPATFVLGPDGRVKARFVDPDFRRRKSIEDIMCTLAINRSQTRPF